MHSPDLISQRNLILSQKVAELFFDPVTGSWIPSAYKVMRGGRGGLKSWGFARVSIILATHHKCRFTCAREYQNSIAESVHETLVTNIDLLDLRPYFTVRDTYIASNVTGSIFTFAGIKTEPRKFKSREGIDVLWLEEGEKVSEASWQTIVPTVRKEGSEIWCGFNPDLPSDPTSIRFMPITSDKPQAPHPMARVIETNWRDNPWLTPKLIAEKDYLASVDQDAYMHVWEGAYRQHSEAQVLKGKIKVQAIELDATWHGPMFGGDWGFSQDPTAAVKCWVSADKRKLYIEAEAWAIGCDIDKTPALFDTVPGAKTHTMRADSARPETISYMRAHGYGRMVACEKWKGSVEDGVAHLRQYEEIIIHPSNKHAIEEGRLWCYKVDRITGEVLPELVDANNHIWDAVRYALQPLIKAAPGIIGFYEQQAIAAKAKAQEAKNGR